MSEEKFAKLSSGVLLVGSVEIQTLYSTAKDRIIADAINKSFEKELSRRIKEGKE